MDPKSKTLGEIIVFLVLTVILSTLAYIPIIQAGTINGGQSKLAGLLMLAPGLAAVITYLVFEHSLGPIGWRPGKIQYLILGLVIPVIYCLIAYGLVWLTGRGKYNGQFPPNFPIFLVTMLFMLHVFDVLTTDSGGTWLLLGEYGAISAAMGLLLAILFWSLRTRLPEVN